MMMGVPLSAWPSMSTFTGVFLRELACFSDLICSSIRSLTRRASASFASRRVRCSEVSLGGGERARVSGSIESSERRVRSNMEQNGGNGWTGARNEPWWWLWWFKQADGETGRENCGWNLERFYASGTNLNVWGCSSAPVASGTQSTGQLRPKCKASPAMERVRPSRPGSFRPWVSGECVAIHPLQLYPYCIFIRPSAAASARTGLSLRLPDRSVDAIFGRGRA